MPTNTQTTLTTARISFPEIHLGSRAAHQLRGYFGDVFREHSPLLHNHFADGKLRYGYPLVQYKVIAGIPVLVGLREGAELLAELFFQIKVLQLDGREYSVHERDIEFSQWTPGISDSLEEYRFETLYMPLNQENYVEFMSMQTEGQRGFLGRILVGNILSFFKGIGLFLPSESPRIVASIRPSFQTSTGFKGQRMLAFGGSFTTNALLPDLVGIGRSVSRGFGAIRRLTT